MCNMSLGRCKCGKKKLWFDYCCYNCLPYYLPIYFEDEVEVIGGFFKGQKGKAIKKKTDSSYDGIACYEYLIKNKKGEFWVKNSNLERCHAPKEN